MPAPLLDKQLGLFPSMDIFQGYGRTENAGTIDRAGYVYLVDRVEDMIVTGGKTPVRPESKDGVSSHHSVLQSAVTASRTTCRANTCMPSSCSVPGRRPPTTNHEPARARIAGYKVPGCPEP